MAFFLTFHQNFNQVVLFIFIEMVDSVSIIPVDSEILCCRVQLCETVYRLVGIGDSLWVGVFRYTPDPFHCRICAYKLFYHIHIRSGRSHWDIDHLDSKMLCNRKMSVISRNRT